RRPRYGGPWDIGARPSCQPGRQSPVLGGAPILPRRPPCPVGRPAELALAPLAVPGDAAVLGDLAVGAGPPSGLRNRPALAGLSTLEAGPAAEDANELRALLQGPSPTGQHHRAASAQVDRLTAGLPAFRKEHLERLADTRSLRLPARPALHNECDLALDVCAGRHECGELRQRVDGNHPLDGTQESPESGGPSDADEELGHLFGIATVPARVDPAAGVGQVTEAGVAPREVVIAWAMGATRPEPPAVVTLTEVGRPVAGRPAARIHGAEPPLGCHVSPSRWLTSSSSRSVSMGAGGGGSARPTTRSL